MQHRAEADQQRCAREHHARQPGRPGRPGGTLAPGARRDRLDNVVEVRLWPLRLGRHEIQHLAVAYPLCRQGLGRRERHTVRTTQHPSTVLLPVVGQPVPGVAQQLREQVRERHLIGQRDIDAAVWGLDRDAGQAGWRAHRRNSVT
jgi:hypothetical protein